MKRLFAYLGHTRIFAGSVIFLVLVMLVFFLLSNSGGIAEHIDACKDQGPRKQQCFEELILDQEKKKGLSVAFDTLADVYARDTEFALWCHGNTHQLGELAYEHFKRGEDIGASLKTAYCGFGFYHGFLEALLVNQGDLKEAERFCDQIDSALKADITGLAFACYHGIGHGVVDGSDPRLWNSALSYVSQGLKICGELADIGQHRERCSSGVFNALAVAYILKPKPRVEGNPHDPYAVCRTLLEPYEKRACYDQMNGYVVMMTPVFQEALLIAANSSEPVYREIAIRSVATYRAQATLAEPSTRIKRLLDCGTLQSYLGEICIHGFVAGLIEHGKPGVEYEVPIYVCARSGALAQACFRGVSIAVKDRFQPATYDKICAAIGTAGGSERGKECREIMKIPPSVQ